jgi:hypothetical protein
MTFEIQVKMTVVVVLLSSAVVIVSALLGIHDLKELAEGFLDWQDHVKKVIEWEKL